MIYHEISIKAGLLIVLTRKIARFLWSKEDRSVVTDCIGLPECK